MLLRVIGNGELYIQKQPHRVVLQTSWSQSSYLLFIFIFLLHFSKISNKTQMKNAFSVTFMALACNFTTTTTNKSNIYNNFSEISLIFSDQIFFSTNLGECFCVCLFTRKWSRHILYLVYWCPYLGLGLFKSLLCDLFFIFSLTFIVINQITSFIVDFSEYFPLFLDDNVKPQGVA